MSERIDRPWGWYQTLYETSGHKVKTIHVHAGQRLSLQKHARRAEHWVVVLGTARVQLGDRLLDLSQGQHVAIAVGELHRLTNLTDDALEIVEVQLGGYLGEDDIVRMHDDFGRT